MLGVAEGVTGLGVLHAQQGDDVAGLGRVQFLAGVGVHLDDAADALGFAGEGVQHRVALLDLPGVDTGEGQGAEAVVHDLEGQGAQGALGIDDGVLAGLVALQVDLGLGLDLHGIGQVVDHGVEHQLHALVLEGRAAVGGEEVQVDGALADAGLHRLQVGFLTLQILLQGLVVLLQGDLDQLLAPFLDLVGHVGGDVLDAVVLRGAGVVPDPGLAGQQIDDADKAALQADGQDHHQGAGAQHVLHLVDDAVEVSADAVELVDVDDAGDAGVVGVAPVGLGLGLDAAGAAKDADAAVQDLEGAIDLDGEVDVTGGVDDVQPTALPLAGGGGGLDGDAALGLLLHEVHGGLAVMHLTQAVNLAGELENTLGSRRLSRVHVGEDTDVSVV